MFKKILEAFRSQSDQDRMSRYLSQATDIHHLEWLQKEWDRKASNNRMWG